MLNKLAQRLISARVVLLSVFLATSFGTLIAFYLPWSGSPFLKAILAGGGFSLVFLGLLLAILRQPNPLDAPTHLKALALQKLQVKYLAVIEHAREVMFQISPSGDWTFLNPEWERLTGFTVQQTLGTNFIDYVYANDRPRTQDIFNSLMAGDRDTLHRMVRWPTQSGEFLWVDIFARPSFDSNGAVVSVEGSFTDVTERVKAVDALQASEEKYRLLCNTSTDTIIMMDKTGSIDYVNPAVTALFGYTPEQLIGQNISLLQPERMREAHRRGMQRYLEHGLKKLDWRSTEVVGLHIEGSEFPLEIAFSNFDFDHKEMFIGFMRNISLRKQAEQDLRSSEQRYALAITGSNTAIWDWNIVTGELYYSARWKEILGYQEHEIVGSMDEFESRLYPDDREAGVRSVKDHFKTRAPFASEFRIRAKDGSYLWIKALGQAVWDKTGRATRMAGTVFDITARKHAELDAGENA